MHIYSAEDFLEISRQVLQVGSLYTDSYIDLTTYNQNENGYTIALFAFPKEEIEAVEV